MFGMPDHEYLSVKLLSVVVGHGTELEITVQCLKNILKHFGLKLRCVKFLYPYLHWVLAKLTLN